MNPHSRSYISLSLSPSLCLSHTQTRTHVRILVASLMNFSCEDEKWFSLEQKLSSKDRAYNYILPM